MKSYEDEDCRWQIDFRDGHVMDHGSDVLNQLIGGLLRVRKASFHAMSSSKEVKVVGVVHHVVHAARSATVSQIDAVGLGCDRIASRRRSVVADTHVNVRGHMNKMACHRR